MAKAVILDVIDGQLKKISNKDYYSSKITFESPRSKIENIIPFRVKFTSVGVSSYGANNPAPIGIAIIGFNNYIL